MGIGSPAISITVEVHVWDAVLNPTGDIVNGAGYKGSSGPFLYTWEASFPPAPTDTQLVTMPAFSISPIPEPSVIALSLLGVAGMLLFRHRK